MIKALTKTPEAPSYLGSEGRAEWERIMPVLVKNRMVNELSLNIIAYACRCYEWSFEEPYTTNAGTLAYEHPRAMNDYIAIMKEFGATALTGQRIKPVPKKKRTASSAIED